MQIEANKFTTKEKPLANDACPNQYCLMLFVYSHNISTPVCTRTLGKTKSYLELGFVICFHIKHQQLSKEKNNFSPPKIRKHFSPIKFVLCALLKNKIQTKKT